MFENTGKVHSNKISLIVSLILIIPMIFTCLPDELDWDINGVVENVSPQFTWHGALNGSYQESLEEYLDANLGLRGILIKSGNQMAYTLFNKSTHDSECIGKNKQLYELEYIYKKMQYIEPVTKQYIDELIEKLGDLQTKLKMNGTDLFIFITPSKAEIYPEDIGWIYKKCAPEQKESSYNQLVAGLQKSEIPYFDGADYTNQLKNNEGKKVFALTGTHWTQTTGATVASQLIKELERNFGYDMTEFTVSEEMTDIPTDPDADIFNLLNIIQRPYDQYTTPKIEISKTGTDTPSILCRGGSFMGQSIVWMINNDIVSSAVHMENTYVYQEKYSEIQYFSDYNEIDVELLMENKNILLLEVNQGAIDKMSFGFIDYLLEENILKEEN